VPELGRSLTVIWWRTDGTVVRLTESNQHVFETSKPNPQLVMTLDEMLALVADPDVLLYLPPVR
jgi:hypothetical protein